MYPERMLLASSFRLQSTDAGDTHTAVRTHFQFTTDQSGVVTITFQSVGSNPSYQDAILAGIEVGFAMQIQGSRDTR